MASTASSYSIAASKGSRGAAKCCLVDRGGPRSLAIFDTRRDAVESLVARLRLYYPDLAVEIRNNDPAGYHLVVNATPLGMRPDDPLPFDPQRLDRRAFVGEVVLSTEMTPLLRAASARGCRYQIGTDMLFEQIPAYIEFFGYGATTPDELREAAQIAYYPENVG